MDDLHTENKQTHITEITNPEEIAYNFRRSRGAKAEATTFRRALKSKDIKELRMWIKAIDLLETDKRFCLH